MRRLRGTWSWVTIAALFLLPSLALAEVSVQLDGQGKFKRTWYLTAGKGRNAYVWRQVRPRLPQHVLLNPLGDNLGDGRPVIQASPVTGYPWVVWPKNFGNIRQLVVSAWDGKRWTEPALIVPGRALVYEDRDPSFAIDQAGVPYLVWSRAEQTAEIYFSSMVQGRWTPPLPISEAGVDSRAPSITLDGTRTIITYQTPAGPVTKHYDTAGLMQSAASLMDNPIPPLVTPPPPPGAGGGGPGVRN
jgi:hypothetical protein